MTTADLVSKIKGCRLYKLYHNPTNEISREATDGVNASGQATDRMMALQRTIKQATMRETDFPPELRNDADELRELIQTGLVTLFANAEDGDITNAEFKKVFAPLAGMTEGMLTALNFDDPDKMMSLRSMKAECSNKAFYRQLKKTLHEEATGRERMFAFGKALSSFGTHLFISAEKGGHLPTGLVEEVNEIVASLSAKASRGAFDFADEVARVRAWGLVEGVVTRDKVKGPKNDDTNYKPGGGEKADVTPPQLDQSPGNPKDVKPGKEPKQKDGKKMDGGLKNTIDGEPSNTPTKEHVEFLVRIPKTSGQMEWNVRCGGTRIGEAWRRVFLGGSEHKAKIAADVLFEKLVESNRDIEVSANDIFSLQVRVLEALNKMAKELKVDRRFTIAR